MWTKLLKRRNVKYAGKIDELFCKLTRFFVRKLRFIYISTSFQTEEEKNKRPKENKHVSLRTEGREGREGREGLDENVEGE